MEGLFAILAMTAMTAILIAIVYKSGSKDRSSPPRPAEHEKLEPMRLAHLGPTRPRTTPPRPMEPKGGAQHDVTPSPAPRELKGRAWVIDGDTIAIDRIKIRLAGIDAPELDQPWGQKSKWAMVRICKGNTITAVLNGERSHDRYVATCFLPDGRDIGAEIIKEGLALDCATYSKDKYRKFEPDGARRKLGFGKFGHRSLHTRKA